MRDTKVSDYKTKCVTAGLAVLAVLTSPITIPWMLYEFGFSAKARRTRESEKKLKEEYAQRERSKRLNAAEAEMERLEGSLSRVIDE